MNATCIVAARDYALTRTLKRVMEPTLEVVATIDNLASLTDAIESLRPDVMIVDAELLGPDPRRSLEVLRQRFAHTPIVGLVTGPDVLDASSVATIVDRQHAAHDLVPAAHAAIAGRSSTRDTT